jgi:hypothetical protein
MTPNATLRAEWDVESTIVDSYKQLGIHFTFLHVKSHQDDDGPVAGLTLEAQLNVQADALATAALKDAPTYSKVALFPTAKCQLIIAGKLITRKIPQAIRYQAGLENIQTYLMERNKWNQATFHEIAWEPMGKHMLTTEHIRITSSSCAIVTSLRGAHFIAAMGSTRLGAQDAMPPTKPMNTLSDATQRPESNGDLNSLLPSKRKRQSPRPQSPYRIS